MQFLLTWKLTGVERGVVRGVGTGEAMRDREVGEMTPDAMADTGEMLE